MSKIEVGQKAPDFKLIGTDLQPVSLKEYKGKNLILHFFPLAFTSICTAQLCLTNNDKELYNKFDTDVLGVSVDSPFVLKKFGAENALNFPLASDYNRTVSKTYGVLFDDDFAGMTNFSKRSVFVIDGKGIVHYKEITDGKALPSFENINKTLKSL
ncbi:redoxin domain-containing protein [Aquimarina sp. RZ0]|uniref:redoxin domain-containing protein n=1 Tax=Aquimarina sp. RZ0 TaxID=2607730 RepID=UPI0011F0B4C0|nr:redoxin domain-containing protein [Aquimarina sp. RZ0]KAA1244923.1 redoxin domain-containing protein [Aquimarina sp. RZ0]